MYVIRSFLPSFSRKVSGAELAALNPYNSETYRRPLTSIRRDAFNFARAEPRYRHDPTPPIPRLREPAVVRHL